MELVVGRVAKSHGVRGELVVDIRTDSPEERFAPGSVLLGRAPRGGGDAEYVVEAARSHSGRLLLRLEGVGDRDSADALRGTLFLVDSADLDAPDDPEEFHDHQLIGLRADLPDGSALGEVVDVEHSGAGERLVVRRSDVEDGRNLLVPFVHAIVPEVDLGAGRVVVDPPEGLLEL